MSDKNKESPQGNKVIVYSVENKENGEIVHTDLTTTSCIELANKLNYGKRGKDRLFRVKFFYKTVAWDEYGYEEFLDEEEIIEDFK